MEQILFWGLDVIRSIQTIASPGLTTVMKILTQAGSEYFYLFFLPVFLWCINERFGARLGIVFLFSAFVNAWLKIVFAQPRPYDLDPSLGFSHETSYGLPSGHAQGTSTFWGLLAPLLKKPLGLILAITIPLLVAFTRLYLGVHFPTDVFLGLALGWSFALINNCFSNTLVSLLKGLHMRYKLILVALAALGMNALNMHNTDLSGIFFGATVGIIFMLEKVHFNAATGSMAKKVLRFILGIVITAAIYFGGQKLAPGRGHELYALFRFIRYGITGIWVTLGAPLLFIRLGLAEKHQV
jgi:membrane-associated phospholipid phosphatase